MTRLPFPACGSLAIVILLALGRALAAEEPAPSPLVALFRDPPRQARPDAYWAWMNGYFDTEQLTRELEDMKAKGLGGAQIFDVGAQDPAGVVPAGPAFMGPESVRAIGHAVREAKRLGLRVGLTTSSSWNAGGSWVPPELASMGLSLAQSTVEGPARFDAVLPFPTVPPAAPKGPDGLPLVRHEVALLAVPAQENPDPAAVVNLSGRMGAGGRLVWDVPAGKWILMRLVCTNTGEGLHVPSPNSRGLAIDHFNARATQMHFQLFIDRLRAELGDLDKTALEYLYLCSYELRGLIWTPDMVGQFRRRRGYDPTPYLPVLFGTAVGGPDTSSRFRHDFDLTLSDLIIEEFYAAARNICRDQGLGLCAEAGGPGPPLHQVPVDALRALGTMDTVRGEFWNQYHLFVVKETACAAHVYGKPIVDMESFTSWRHWQDGPGDLKPVADRALCEGTNHFTLHTWPHRPPQAGTPGWAYAAGEHMGSSRAWWPKARPFIDYLARCSYLLQQGLPVADVCYYYGDQGYNFVPPKHVDPSLGPGYDYDVANAEVMLTRMDVRDGRIVLPDGMSYALLALPDREDSSPEVLRKLGQLVSAGATVVGRKPIRSSGLTDYPHQDEEVHRLADELWGPCDGQAVREHTFGKGRVLWGPSLREILAARGIGPDFAFQSRRGDTELDYIHRRTPEADIYFVSNKKPQWEEVDCTFRVAGRQPELWTPEDGEVRSQPVFAVVEGGTKVPLRLAPWGSVFVVFRGGLPAEHAVAVRHDGASLFPVAAGAVEEMPAVEIAPAGDGKWDVLAWKPGVYTLETSQGSRAEARIESIAPPEEIAGPWELRFPEDWGAPPHKTLPKLISWTDDADEGVRYFSGIAAYEKEFEVPGVLLSPGTRLYLDLGRVRLVADVRLNGRHLGILWTDPFRLDVTEAVRPGANRLVVEVANDWSNRLVGDARSPSGPHYCRTNIARALTQKSPWKDHPLQESGLLGPVRLIPARLQNFETNP